MPLMGSLYIGTSALQASQNALNTTAHNMSNIDTTGYVRQIVSLSDKRYNTISVNTSSISNQQLGLGVTYSAVTQVRNYFLDQAYRKESGRSAFYEASYETFTEIQDVFGELDDKSTFSNTLKNLWESVQELAKEPSNTVKQGLLVQRASQFLSHAKEVYTSLQSYQDNLNLQVESQVEKINKYGKQINELNQQINAIESGGVEHANDLRDARNQILDELSSLVNISYEEDVNNIVRVSIEGTSFVTSDSVYEMGLDTDKATGFYTPFWPQKATYTLNSDNKKVYNIAGAEVFDLSKTVSMELDTDVGSLKSLLLARGDHAATYEDLADKQHYDQNISQSILMNVQAEFDQLINKITTSINQVLSDAAARATALDPNSAYMRPGIGEPAYQLFETIDGTTFTISNIKMNSELQEQPSKLGFVLADNSEDKETTNALKALFEDAIYTLNPNLTKKNTFAEYYSDLIDQIGNSGMVCKSLVSTQQETIERIETTRQQVIGVSQEEELTNMIKFQNAYNAASRYINVIDEMLEHIINTLGN